SLQHLLAEPKGAYSPWLRRPARGQPARYLLSPWVVLPPPWQAVHLRPARPRARGLRGGLCWSCERPCREAAAQGSPCVRAVQLPKRRSCHRRERVVPTDCHRAGRLPCLKCSCGAQRLRFAAGDIAHACSRGEDGETLPACLCGGDG